MERAVASALAGLTVEQEWLLNATYFGANLSAAVRRGDVPLAAVDGMAARVLTTEHLIYPRAVRRLLAAGIS
jgi:hypothetical protein